MKYPNCPNNAVCSVVSHVDKAIKEFIECATQGDYNPAYNATIASFMLKIVFDVGPTAGRLRPDIPPSFLRCAGCIYAATHQDEE